jgi:hypothetical protein
VIDDASRFPGPFNRLLFAVIWNLAPVLNVAACLLIAGPGDLLHRAFTALRPAAPSDIPIIEVRT